MRLDVILAEKGLVRSRQVAVELIKSGQVLVNGKIMTKPAKDFADTANLKIEIKEQPKYVGRGGLKLEAGLKEFGINPQNLICLDVGSSTGGFTDCLLQNGAKKVYAVDVGTDQFNQILRNDPRISLMEQTDIRNVKNLPDKIDLAVIDVSFISLKLVLATVKNLIKNSGAIIALIKPQFETTKTDKNKSGIVKNDELREKVLTDIKNYSQEIGLKISKIIPSPILGGSGNKEYLLLGHK